MSAQRTGEGLPEAAARKVRLVVFDVDGVLTDGGVYLGRLPDGGNLEMKRFDIQDGFGVKMLQWAGLEVAWISGRTSDATTLRAEELGIEECHQDTGAHKLPILEDLLARKGVHWSEVAMLADDIPDLSILRKVGLPVVVADAQPEVVEVAAWQTTARGGEGAVREFCRALLVAREEWDDLVTAYVAERSRS